jgi:hypothetical protein
MQRRLQRACDTSLAFTFTVRTNFAGQLIAEFYKSGLCLQSIRNGPKYRLSIGDRRKFEHSVENARLIYSLDINNDPTII